MSDSLEGYQMNRPPRFLFDPDVAQEECHRTLDELADQVGRLREIVESEDSHSTDALRVSFEEAIPDLKHAGQAAIARLQILAHIRAGTIVWRGGESGKNTD
jgi:hypothetical protein